MKKKPIILSALGLLLCLSLVFTAVFHSPMVAFAVEMPEDNEYVFEAGDAFRVIGWYGDWSNDYPKPTDKRWIDSKLTYNGTKWKTDPYMRWQNTDQPHNFLGVWPYDLVDSNTDLTNITYNTLTAAEKDILVAHTTLADRPSNHTVPLVFDHLMSRFDVNLTFANQYQEVDHVVVKVNVDTAATLDLIANEIILGNEQNNVILEVIDTASGMTCSRRGILIPQTKTDAVITIDFAADGMQKSVTYTMPELKLESGKATTLNLLVGDEVVVIDNVTVTPWADGGNIAGGEAEEAFADVTSTSAMTTVAPYADSTPTQLYYTVTEQLKNTAFTGNLTVTGELTAEQLKSLNQAIMDHYGNGEQLQSLWLPDMTTLPADAFMNNDNIKILGFPKVSEIGNKAFYNCSGLSFISFGSPVTKVGTDAFSDTAQMRIIVSADQKQLTGDNTNGWIAGTSAVQTGENAIFCGYTFAEIANQ